MNYRLGETKSSRRPIRAIIVGAVFLCGLATIGLFGTYKIYTANLGARAPESSEYKEITIVDGASLQSIATQLKQEEIIKSDWAFKRYAQVTNASRYLQAGTYSLGPSQSVQDIVSTLTKGKVASKLIVILPGQRLDQIRRALIQQGFTESEVDAALAPEQYESSAALADKPKGSSLEGYLYPESFQKTGSTTAKSIVESSISQMQRQVTPEIRAGFQRQGLSTYQGLIIASIVEKEVVHQTDRKQAAQVFITRIKKSMPLGSDVTAFYGSELAGKGQDVTYDTPYNTRIHSGLPPTPISNISKSSLEAVAYPANTDWVFFVAGDDGVTHFSRTVEEHEALTKKYCIKLCQ
ncbi:MAG: Endolytic murein transglycosylase [Patescibacteria group bacterium]|nr:endolytic transglycosylase MltG [Candidatus Saccharibacteria bacterium]MDQ5963532.1 Endolytic murein transglycosylase [Patescibacteria group bacterium]